MMKGKFNPTNFYMKRRQIISDCYSVTSIKVRFK